MKLPNFKTAQAQIFFKKLLLIVGLMTVFVSVMQQDFDLESGYSIGSAQVNIAQLDKDHLRDAGDKALISMLPYYQPSEKSAVYFFFSASYQEPIQLVQQRPPIA